MRYKIYLSALFFLLFSCNGLSKKTYLQAAEETCKCVTHIHSKGEQEAKAQNYGLSYAICTIEIEKKFKLDVQDEAFEQALKSQCPDLYTIHNDVVNNAIQLQNQKPE
jgi:hypothetical protein